MGWCGTAATATRLSSTAGCRGWARTGGTCRLRTRSWQSDVAWRRRFGGCWSGSSLRRRRRRQRPSPGPVTRWGRGGRGRKRRGGKKSAQVFLLFPRPGPRGEQGGCGVYGSRRGCSWHGRGGQADRGEGDQRQGIHPQARPD